jgi:hypothetical protein
VLLDLDFSLDPEDDTGELYMSDEGVKKFNDFLSRYKLEKLSVEIMRCVEMYLNTSNVIPKVELKNVMSIMTLLKPGSESTKHNHHPSCLVIVYYHKTFPHCGNIRLYTPVERLEFQKEPYVDIVPEAGKILVFPGWLYHEVLKNNSDSVRHSIAITMQVYEDLITG